MTRDNPYLPAPQLRETLGNLSPEETVRPDLAEPQALARERFTVEWGIRTTDRALVLHLFPHIVEDNVAVEWDENFRMDKRLDYAIPQVFDTRMVNAGFEPAMNSFYIIVAGVIAPDLRLLVQRFLELIEGAPVAH